MALFGNSVGAAKGAVATAEKRVADCEAERVNAIAAADAEPDFDKGLAIRNTVPTLDGKIAQAKVALEHARASLKDAEEAEASSALDEQRKAAVRAAKEGEKLSREVGPDAVRLAAKYARIDECNALVAAFNKVRGDRPHVRDGEAVAREVPEKHFPTVYETLTVWVDPKTGRKPSHYREVAGEMVPADHGTYEKRTEKCVSRNAYSTPATIPGGRFADAITLISPTGEKLYPSR